VGVLDATDSTDALAGSASGFYAADADALHAYVSFKRLASKLVM